MSEISQLRALVEDLQERVAALELGIAGDVSRYRLLGLTPRESQVLTLLMKRGIVTRDALRIVLYGSEGEQSDRVIDAHLTHIRQKISALGVTVVNVRGNAWYLAPRDKATIEQRATELAERNWTQRA